MSKAAVLIFGEDTTDTGALRIIIRALLPDYDVATRRDPVILSRGAARRKRGNMADRIAAFARAEEARRSKVIVVAHRDCDSCEPAHEMESVALEAELTTAGVSYPVAACPAWEMETWWMIYPEALSLVRRCWREVNYKNRNVGSIENSKEQLIRDLRPHGFAAKTCPDYSESDSSRIAEEIISLGILKERINKSASLSRFYTRLYSAAIS